MSLTDYGVKQKHMKPGLFAGPTFSGVCPDENFSAELEKKWDKSMRCGV